MKPFTALAAALLLVPAALAQHQAFVADAAASEVKITLNTTHEIVYGTFHIQSGSIELDRAASKMSGSVVVLAGSGKTGNGTRDNRMYKEVLLIKQHAAISFEPKSYTGSLATSGDSTIQVTGIFNLLDKPHEITIPVSVHLDGSVATVKAHFLLPFVQWGLKNPSFLFWKVDNDVAIDLNLTCRLSN